MARLNFAASAASRFFQIGFTGVLSDCQRCSASSSQRWFGIGLDKKLIERDGG
ncbi:MAG: hypothetical protein QNJ46_07125 [Leptolyngbyaceae cyanobacterium MO_188.B28]|nr:hypothetical protein [Leptolyngbyaceae cyanobacterium MO_188.B28]